jgi:hypothetical protein
MRWELELQASGQIARKLQTEMLPSRRAKALKDLSIPNRMRADVVAVKVRPRNHNSNELLDSEVHRNTSQ